MGGLVVVQQCCCDGTVSRKIGSSSHRRWCATSPPTNSRVLKIPFNQLFDTIMMDTDRAIKQIWVDLVVWWMYNAVVMDWSPAKLAVQCMVDMPYHHKYTAECSLNHINPTSTNSSSCPWTLQCGSVVCLEDVQFCCDVTFSWYHHWIGAGESSECDGFWCLTKYPGLRSS